jgi:hypothetical protein
MRSETVRKEDLSKVEWDDSYFKYCEFDDFYLEGNIACSDFVSCSFNKIDWYWGFFSGANFHTVSICRLCLSRLLIW